MARFKLVPVYRANWYGDTVPATHITDNGVHDFVRENAIAKGIYVTSITGADIAEYLAIPGAEYVLFSETFQDRLFSAYIEEFTALVCIVGKQAREITRYAEKCLITGESHACLCNNYAAFQHCIRRLHALRAIIAGNAGLDFSARAPFQAATCKRIFSNFLDGVERHADKFRRLAARDGIDLIEKY